MLIIKLLMLFIMLGGLLCTLAPRLYGTVIILFVAIVDAAMLDRSVFFTPVFASLLVLTVVAEIGARGLRMFLTKRYEVSRIYSVNSIICNLAGSIIADVLVGSLIGMTLWQGLAGRMLYPRLDSIRKVLIRLMITATVRFACGLIMIILIISYMM